MSDIFISYSKQERSVAETLAYRLNAFGIELWWDVKLYAGEDFQDAIAAALDAARIVIVIWSDTAVRSSWVRGEARRGMDQNKLIPIHVPQFELAKIPIPFNERHTGNVEDFPAILRAVHELGVKAPLARRIVLVPMRELGEHPIAGGKVELVLSNNSSLGMYCVRHGAKLVFLPTNRIKPDELTMDQAVVLLKRARPRPPPVSPKEHWALARKLREAAQKEPDPAKAAKMNRFALMNERAARRDDEWPERFKCFCEKGELRWEPKQRVYKCSKQECSVVMVRSAEEEGTVAVRVGEKGEANRLSRVAAWARAGMYTGGVKIYNIYR
jgi:TIR domain